MGGQGRFKPPEVLRRVRNGSLVELVLRFWATISFEGPEAELANEAFVLALLDGEDTEPLATGGRRCGQVRMLRQVFTLCNRSN